MTDLSVIYKIQTSTASISLTASVVLVSMITLTPKRLTTPYRRLIFGMSIFDIIQSIGMLSGPYAVPVGTRGAIWANGNIASCEANGFCNMLGLMAVPIYTLALSVRYNCKLNMKVHDSVFTKKIEKWFHLSIIVVLVLCITALCMDSFNPIPSGSFCYVEEYPFLCRDMPQFVGECERGVGSDTLSYIAASITCLCFVGIIVNVSMLCVYSCTVERMYRSRAGDPQNLAEYNCVKNYMLCIPCRNYYQFEHEPDADYVLRLYKKETFIQSLLYVGAYLACYAFPMMQTIGSFFNYQFPRPFLYLIAIFYPLGGFFNVLTYTRPKVVRLLHSFPDMKRFTALLIVLKAGGEMPDLETNPNALMISTSCMTSCKKRPKQGSHEITNEDMPPDDCHEKNNALFEMFASLSD